MNAIAMIRVCGERQFKGSPEPIQVLGAPEVPYTPEIPATDRGLEGHVPIGYETESVWA